MFKIRNARLVQRNCRIIHFLVLLRLIDVLKARMFRISVICALDFSFLDFGFIKQLREPIFYSVLQIHL